MRKRKKSEAMRLHRETVRQLAEEALEQAAGNQPAAHGLVDPRGANAQRGPCTNEATGCLT